MDTQLPDSGSGVTAPLHLVNARPLTGSHPGLEVVYLGMGCFWGAERIFWETSGVWVTAVGYAGGHLENPDYRTVCSGRTGHAEVVKVVYDPTQVSLEELLQKFWEGHDPTQGMRQGNDIGTQYRSCIYCDSDAQLRTANQSKDEYQEALAVHGYGNITTEVRLAPVFYLAEDDHQQYLHRIPNGYCGLSGTGVVSVGSV